VDVDLSLVNIDAVLYRNGYWVLVDVSIEIKQNQELLIEMDDVCLTYEEKVFNPHNLESSGYLIKKGENKLLFRFLVKNQEISEYGLKNFIEKSSFYIKIKDTSYLVKKDHFTIISFHKEEHII
jgi:hypothetical protein